MPVTSVPATGAITIASARSVIRLTVSLTADAAFATRPVAVGNLPRLWFWLRHTTPAAGVGIAVIPQFSVSDTVVAGVVVPEFLNLPIAGPLPFNVPVLLNYVVAAKLVRLALTRVAGSAAQTVEVAYGGTQ
ncbi:MAG: hypothetical protein Q8Q85_00060 [Gemmatimonadales bacterium]|nr:hypothetical protein [Gemmatimonadales bacterium]